MPYVPKLGYSLGTQYTYALSDKFDVIGRVDLHHKGKQYWETLNTAGARSAFNLVDARVSLAAPGGKWSLSAWTKNALNKKYNTEFVAGGFTYPAEPRSYGLDLDYTY